MKIIIKHLNSPRESNGHPPTLPIESGKRGEFMRFPKSLSFKRGTLGEFLFK
jgi:hypothetical protein